MQPNWNQNNNQTRYQDYNKMNTWSSKKQDFGYQCSHQHNHDHHHHDDHCQHHDHQNFKKMRTFSNEYNKIQRHVSDLQAFGQQQQSLWQSFSKNQITGQNMKSGLLNINLGKGDDFLQENNLHNISSASSKASTNDNSNSDVEIIEDDYAKGL